MASSTIQPKFLSKSDQLGVVAANFSGGQASLGKPGVDLAPSALIKSGLLEHLNSKLGYEIHFNDAAHSYEDFVPVFDSDEGGMKNPLMVSAVTQKLSKQVFEHAKEGRFVLTLGGDHSIAIGTVSGTAKATKERLGREIVVVWVDAHADINTPETSNSGNIHGMPVAFVTGLVKKNREDIFGWLKEDHMVNVKKLVYIGLRDVDWGEKQILRDYGIRTFSMSDINKLGIGRVMEMTLDYIGNDTPVHLSFDIDALDPSIAPCTGTPVTGGLTLWEGEYIVECLHETGLLIAMDLVEINPALDADINDIGAQDTLRAGSSLVRCAMGELMQYD
ncbi:arginase [Xylogone sp. PMI_703]|nr:arginase [Xylogone sp. PMI_703]